MFMKVTIYNIYIYTHTLWECCVNKYEAFKTSSLTSIFVRFPFIYMWVVNTNLVFLKSRVLKFIPMSWCTLRFCWDVSVHSFYCTWAFSLPRLSNQVHPVGRNINKFTCNKILLATSIHTILRMCPLHVLIHSTLTRFHWTITSWSRF